VPVMAGAVVTAAVANVKPGQLWKFPQLFSQP
jgi:hypothetical protein